MQDGERASLPWRRIAGRGKALGAIEPLLDGPIRFQRRRPRERRVHAVKCAAYDFAERMYSAGCCSE
jgi:hypothetical protein